MSDWREGAPPEDKGRLTDSCARCGDWLTADRRCESFVGCLYCKTCLPIVNWNRTAETPELPKTPTGVVIHDPAVDFGVVGLRLTYPASPRNTNS